MSEATLLLRLAAPMQGWDSELARVTPEPGKALTRDLGADQLAPTHTGIVGLLGSALGRERGAPIGDLLALTVIVRADQPGTPQTEFRTHRMPLSTGRIVPRPFRESVLEDAIFVVGVGGNRVLLDEIAHALTHPTWALYLGKREFPPTLPLLLGVVDGDPESVVRRHRWLASDWYRCEQGRRVHVRMTAVLPRRRWQAGASTRLASVDVDNPLGVAGPDWLGHL